MRFLKPSAVLLLILFSTFASAQNATIRGFVYDKENGEPMIFTNVFLKGTTYGASTDVNGYYSITKIKPGTYRLMVNSIGYDTVSASVTVNTDEIISKKLYLVKRAIELNTVDISADKQEARTEVRMSVQKVTTKEIRQVATVGGEADIAQYMQILPGVVSTGDQGGQLYIRGGSPIQNKVLLDGMVIYNPFHSIGLFSVFDADIIRNADIYTGGFGAEHGGRISSIMDIKTRDGNKKRFGGKVSSSPFMSKLILEGPLSKQTDEDKGSSTFILSGKTSYLQQTSDKLYNYGTLKGVGIPYNFTDLYGKVSFNSSNGSKLNVFGFNFSDNVNYQNVSNLNWNSYGFGSNFVVIPGSSPVLIDGAAAYSQYDISMQEAQNKPRTSSIKGFNMGLNFTYFLQKDEVKYGIDLQAYETAYHFSTAIGRSVDINGTNTEVVGFVKYKKVFKKFLIEPGVHLHYYAKLDEFPIEPRLGAKYNVTDKFRLKFAGGLYSQNLISANSDRDVVNLFYGFLTGPETLPEKFNGKSVDSKLQKARHLIVGFEYDLPKNFELNVEAYVKDFYQLTNINRDKLYEDTQENINVSDEQKKDFIVEQGQAKGIDFLLKYDHKRIYFWATYSYAFVTRDYMHDGQLVQYAPHFDRRHNVSLVSAYTFGKGQNWEIDGRWSFGSGFPFTQTQGFYPKQDFNQGITTNYTNNNPPMGIILSGLNEGRLPYYHRLDFTVKRHFQIGENSNLETFVSVTNVYNRDNIFYIDRVTGNKVYQLPFLPSAGLSLSF